MEEKDGLSTTRQIASFVEVTPRTIQNWVRLGFISRYKIGKSIRFCQEEVLADLKKFRIEAGK